MKTLSGKELIKMGYPEGRVIGIAVQVMLKSYKKSTHENVLQILKNVLENPAAYIDHEHLGKIAAELLPKKKNYEVFELSNKHRDYAIFGNSGIEYGAIHQMEIAMKLPVTVAGALMPDAHQGYGLPIGGVLATKNTVIPYGVGVDIGCRMCLSVFPMDAGFIEGQKNKLVRMLEENTCFGRESFEKSSEHEILDRKELNELALLRNVKDRAWKQLGTSGSGNHFVEFGMVELPENNIFSVQAGQYIALLSHSGSRAMGTTIASHYTKVAKDKCRLPLEASHLAWLDMDSEAGQEYWMAMNFAGDYASACHHVIHKKIAKALGEKVMVRVENHHNFAWKEMFQGEEVIVHRKGATPASEGTLGIIPGSMTSPGFIVQGKGIPESIMSASHGAGRVMSRTKAKASFTGKMMRDELKRHGVTLLGGGIDESPMAYKDIHEVMKHQQSLVETVGIFYPKIVRMCGDDTPSED